ncbi:MAG TPA: hypothetical protein VN426_10710 [Syntrophomonadaceae bacterium]|nr:hypothetical protein [Syntrophomonadaceae bacterium]
MVDNWKSERSGHVFQDRFRSEKVEQDSYLLIVVRYIHQNPVKAAIVARPKEYRWSSCRVYYGKEENPQGLTQPKIILEQLLDDKDTARKIFMEYMAEGTSSVSDEIVCNKIKIINGR